ncbi:PucR family transcriptional regulator [Mycobacterium sp. ACS1612]|uniref:PucR family transcriptional regulator n=1 Tax=Mycobacterium sp. ACS1612 TaxID=1834117 RepID=UPI0018D2AE51|nr:PucR family transcriptional regulator [Mycobacterium sp. ACS1612]
MLRQVLSHPVLQPASPVLLSGAEQLDHSVRWVHTADLYDIAPLLRGDEVLLTNGVGLVGVDEVGRRLYVRRLAESGVAGLLFEVGRTFAEVPAEMVAEGRDVGLPVVELQPVLRFTEVAEAVNSELIDRSVARLRHADEISRTLSEKLARGASLRELIEHIGVALGTWARLSDYAGRIVVTADRLEPDDGPRSEAPVLVEGTAWGRLTVGAQGVPEVFIEAVMERAPTVLGLCLIREQQDVAGALRAQQLLLDQLATNQAVERRLLEARMRAAGVATADHEYACIAVDPRRVESAAKIVDGLIRQAGHGIFGLVEGTLCALVAGQIDDATPNLAHVVRSAARDALPRQARLCAAVGRAVRDPSDLPRAMSEARETLALGQDLHVKHPVVSVQTLALERMLSAHGNLAATRRFVDDQIGILERTDSAKSGQLAHTLEVLAACGGNKAEAAKRLHMRRQSLYYRLDQIAKLLDVDLDDPKQLITLAVAVTARRILSPDNA